MAVRPAAAGGVVLPILSASVRLYGALLALYPKAFRRRTKPYNDAKSFEACYEEIGYRTICGPWRFEVEVPDRG